MFLRNVNFCLYILRTILFYKNLPNYQLFILSCSVAVNLIIAMTDYSKSLIRDVRVKEIRKVSNFAFPKVYILQKSFQICTNHKFAKLQINHFESFGNVNNLIK